MSQPAVHADRLAMGLADHYKLRGRKYEKRSRSSPKLSNAQAYSWLSPRGQLSRCTDSSVSQACDPFLKESDVAPRDFRLRLTNVCAGRGRWFPLDRRFQGLRLAGPAGGARGASTRVNRGPRIECAEFCVRWCNSVAFKRLLNQPAHSKQFRCLECY